MENGKTLKVIIVGGGLVGSLSACYFGEHGHEVHLYEYRDDIRRSQLSSGRSINLVLSHRGRAALKIVGLEDTVLQHGIPIKGRMIHEKDGKLKPSPYDPVYNQVIYSVSRKKLNETLLTGVEKYPNVKTYFQCKLVNADLEAGVAHFMRSDNNEGFSDTADLIVGADGVYSTVRKEMIMRPMYNFSQNYIEHGYVELCIPPNGHNDFAMERNYLHIWPRGTFMMIALPNQDRSWTVTLFMPFRMFSTLDSSTALLKFFDYYFPDGLSLIGRDRLVNDFFSTKPSPLVSIKCNPYHVTDKAVLIGDAAHGMVPFYGQGMNAGFEDCRILNSLLVTHMWNLNSALSKYSEIRNPDSEAICDLALYNYIEMRDLVTHRLFRLRKYVDNALYRLLPGTWMPLYNSVMFSHIPYSRCVRNKLRHDKILTSIATMTSVAVTAGLLIFISRWRTTFPLRHVYTFVAERLII